MYMIYKLSVVIYNDSTTFRDAYLWREGRLYFQQEFKNGSRDHGHASFTGGESSLASTCYGQYN